MLAVTVNMPPFGGVALSTGRPGFASTTSMLSGFVVVTPREFSSSAV
jgi:hypothetical protein